MAVSQAASPSSSALWRASALLGNLLLQPGYTLGERIALLLGFIGLLLAAKAAAFTDAPSCFLKSIISIVSFLIASKLVLMAKYFTSSVAIDG